MNLLMDSSSKPTEARTLTPFCAPTIEARNPRLAEPHSAPPGGNFAAEKQIDPTVSASPHSSGRGKRLPFSSTRFIILSSKRPTAGYAESKASSFSSLEVRALWEEPAEAVPQKPAGGRRNPLPSGRGGCQMRYPMRYHGVPL